VHSHPRAADATGGDVKPTLAHVVRRHGAQDDSTRRLSAVQRRALRAIARCRTAELGGHIAQCEACGQRQYRYHSCRNRACPQCQTLAKERWLAARRAELLPVPYFHLVFTLPHELNALAQGNPRAIYGLLFEAVSKTLLEFGRNPRWLGGEIAASLLLHTWNQLLLQHLHVHCLVAGAALTDDGQWIFPKRGFLFPTHALSAVFRGKFLDGLGALLAKGRLKLAGSTAVLAQPSAQRRFLATLRQHDWVVYAKRSLAGPQAVLDYLGRYTTKTAISNHRLLGLDDQGNVRLSWRDRANGNRRRILQLPAAQLLDRFVLHVLPPGLVRIRHIGLLANRHKRQQLAQARAALDAPAPAPVPKESAQQLCLRVLGVDIERCPACRLGHLRVVAQIPAAHAPYQARAP
jgi:Putative transposase/Transposase zinc-binding domain